jgi:adenylate cyclase
VAEIDFEAEGLLEGLEGEARDARLALLRDLSDVGIPLEELKAAAAEGRLALLPVERVFEPDGERYTAKEIAERSGLSTEFVLRLRRALGMPRAEPDDRVHTSADLAEAIRAKEILDAGLSEDGLLEVSRVVGVSMAQLASANRDLIGQEFIQPGVNERELAMRYAAAAQAMVPRLADALIYAHNVHLREEIRQAVVTDQELAAGTIAAEDQATIAFADVVGFTRLGESIDVDALGTLTDRLFELATEAASPPVRLVKMIGDAAMFASPEPKQALETVTDLVETAAGEEMPSLRAGVATGQALSRGGDWYGRPVNLAARITGWARADSVVGSQEVKEAVGDDAGFDFSFAGKRHFKGIKGEVPVHRIRRAEGA